MQDKNTIHYEILDKNRMEVLPLLAEFKDIFYLAGGTSLALQLGHRDSVDFDFFTQDNFDESELIEKIGNVFGVDKTKIIQIERGTVSAIINDEIKLSFFNYKYELVSELLETQYFKLASITDIAYMKLSAICSRSVNKDYIDLYFIFKTLSLDVIIEKLVLKYPTIDTNVILKSLVYFEDIEEDPMIMFLEKDLTLAKVEKDLTQKVKKYTTMYLEN